MEGLTISGGEPLGQMAFTRQILAGAKAMGLHTAIETSGFLGDKVDDDYLSNLDLVLLDIKSFDPETYRNATGRDIAPTLAFCRTDGIDGKARLGALYAGPGLTDDPPTSLASPLCGADEERRMG